MAQGELWCALTGTCRRMCDVHRTADLAADFLDSLDERPVFPRTSAEERTA